ncbi:GNAT family N-acetyltransferase [Amycolatopsis sp. NPDC004368]
MSNVPVGLAEQSEIAAYVDFMGGAPAELRSKLGIEIFQDGPVRALYVREDSSMFFNRAGGFGSDRGKITAESVERVRDFFREAGAAASSILVAPPLRPQNWAKTAAALGFTEGATYVKLGCEVETALLTLDGSSSLDPALRVGEVESAQAHEWAGVMMSTFGFDRALVDAAAACVGRPGWRQFAAWEEDRIVGVGSVFLHGECAQIFGGATVPGARRRGVQTALLTARAGAAGAAGCRWLVAETGAERPGEHNSSLHNMLRTGFEPLYERTSWIYRAER